MSLQDPEQSYQSPAPARTTRRSAPRVTNACRNCKQRRRKCDGVRPKCGNCTQHSLECSYDGLDLRRARHSSVEFSALNHRIAFLEQQVRDLMATQITSGAIDVLEGHPEIGQISSLSYPQNDHLLGEFNWDLIPLDGLDAWPWSLADPTTDWMVGGQTWAPSEQTIRMSQALDELAVDIAHLQVNNQSGSTVFVGPTSNLHLGHFCSQNSCGGLTSMVQEAGSRASQTRQEITARERALLNVYKREVHTNFSVLTSSDIGEELEEHEWPVRMPPLLLSIVLAVASFFSKDSLAMPFGDMSSISSGNYLGSFTSMLGYEVDRHCLANVKAFLLRAYLAILQGRLESATIFNSMACAMAKRMGLHVDCSSSRQGPCNGFSPEARDERLKTFWACVWLDRRLAILEGRACHVDVVDITAPRPLSQMQLEPGYSERPLSIELIDACNIDFFCIQDETLAQLYSFSRNSTKEDAVSKGHLRFVTWFGSLPASMKNIHGGQSFHPSFTAFHMCFHAGFILLHRVSLRDEGTGAELANQRCRDSAASITSLLKSYCTYHGNNPADPMVIHAAFTAALVHMVLLLNPDVVTFRSSLMALRSITRILAQFSKHSLYAVMVVGDLRKFARKWSISPANSAAFWESTPLQAASTPQLSVSDVA